MRPVGQQAAARAYPSLLTWLPSGTPKWSWSTVVHKSFLLLLLLLFSCLFRVCGCLGFSVDPAHNCYKTLLDTHTHTHAHGHGHGHRYKQVVGGAARSRPNAMNSKTALKRRCVCAVLVKSCAPHEVAADVSSGLVWAVVVAVSYKCLVVAIALAPAAATATVADDVVVAVAVAVVVIVIVIAIVVSVSSASSIIIAVKAPNWKPQTAPLAGNSIFAQKLSLWCFMNFVHLLVFVLYILFSSMFMCIFKWYFTLWTCFAINAIFVHNFRVCWGNNNCLALLETSCHWQ